MQVFLFEKLYVLAPDVVRSIFYVDHYVDHLFSAASIVTLFPRYTPSFRHILPPHPATLGSSSLDAKLFSLSAHL